MGRRYQPTWYELRELDRRPFNDDGFAAELLALGIPQEIVGLDTERRRAAHEAAEDARIAVVEAGHAMIRKNGISTGPVGARWYTTNRG